MFRRVCHSQHDQQKKKKKERKKERREEEEEEKKKKKKKKKKTESYRSLTHSHLHSPKQAIQISDI